MTTLFLDAEADDLLPMTSRIWVVCTKVGDEERDFQDAEEFKEYAKQVKPTRIVGHNHLGFDLEALRKCWDCGYSVGRVSNFCGFEVQFIDTMLLSQRLNPDREGGHSLDNLAKLAGSHKIDYKGGFSAFAPEMVTYCKQDVIACESVYKMLLKEIERL